MTQLSIELIKKFIELEDEEFYIDKLRAKHQIDPNSSVFHVSIKRLTEDGFIRRIGRGLYRRVKICVPVPLFSIQRKIFSPYELNFPIDCDRQMPLDFAEDIVIREGDCITIGGVSNYGKTAMALNFCAQNIDKRPILMGNEYTTIDNEPTPRLFNRLKEMDWVEWLDENNADKVTLLPVRNDYAEHIVKNKINIIDWINLSADALYNISSVMENIKGKLGKGIAILVLQKGEGATAPRGGQFAKDFTDCELLIDKFSDNESLLTIGKVKEYTKPVIGKTYAFSLIKGIKIINFREVTDCSDCKGKKYKMGAKCTTCQGKGKVDR